MGKELGEMLWEFLKREIAEGIVFSREFRSAALNDSAWVPAGAPYHLGAQVSFLGRRGASAAFGAPSLSPLGAG